MFRKKVMNLDDVVNKFLREESLEAPLLQHRLLDSWDNVVGPLVTKYSGDKFIKNQTLFVKIQNPSLRQDLSMRKTELVEQLNKEVNSQVIVDIRFY
nr:DUF721 domain-containing protein [Prevotella sp.]